MVIQICTLIFHIIFLWFLMGVCGYDFRATAFSKDVVSFLNMMSIWLYIRIKKPTPKTWIPWNKALWKDWGTYLSITIPIAFSFYIEGLMFETSTIIASYLPKMSNPNIPGGGDRFL